MIIQFVLPHLYMYDDISGNLHASGSFTKPFYSAVSGLFELIFVRCRALGGGCWYETMASAVLTKLSVLLGSTCL